MMMTTLLAQAAAEPNHVPLRIIVALFFLLNLVAVVLMFSAKGARSGVAKAAPKFLIYELLVIGVFVMILPFYWMTVTAFKDARTASAVPPVWTPSRVQASTPHPETGEIVAIRPLGVARQTGEEINVVPEEHMHFRRVDQNGAQIVREVPDEEHVFRADPQVFTEKSVLSLELRNFYLAWYRPEETSRGEVNFLTYFLVSLGTSAFATFGTLFTSALAAFAFARLIFWGRDALFYVLLATMMVPGQVLLIPNFLILSQIGLLDTYAALTVPWLASVFTIFLMRQFFMTIPEDLWDAARIDGASRFRYLWQVIVPLSKPVFITAGIFDFLNNWNSLLWPLIVTSSPGMRTLMVGLQNLSDDAGTEYHILMAASCLAIFPVVFAFFFLQRFFIEGIARTGLK